MYKTFQIGDCLYVVKVPVYYRRYPPGRFIPNDACRSKWVLVNGLWNRVETPLQQAQRFDQWFERACFPYHVSPPWKLVPAHPPCLFLPWPMSHGLPMLSFNSHSLESISRDPALASKRLQPLNNCQPAALRVINTLLRLVRGGSGGRTVH